MEMEAKTKHLKDCLAGGDVPAGRPPLITENNLMKTNWL